MTSDARSGLVAAIGATLTGGGVAEVHNGLRGESDVTRPKSSWLWVKTMLHRVYYQVDVDAVHAQSDRLLDAVAAKLPPIADHLEAAEAELLAFTGSPRRSGVRSGPTT